MPIRRATNFQTYGETLCARAIAQERNTTKTSTDSVNTVHIC